MLARNGVAPVSRAVRLPRWGWVHLLAAAAAGALFVISADGPDFGHYMDWATAALERDIFALGGDTLSPTGVPFTLWSFEPGLLFAVTRRLASDYLTLKEAAYLTGWSAAIVFWRSTFAVVRRLVTDSGGPANSAATVTTILAATFVGTHAGLYSHSHATEVFGMAGVAAIWAIGICCRPWRALDTVLAGSTIGLLLLVRPYLLVYAVPAVWIGLSPDRRGV